MKSYEKLWRPIGRYEFVCELALYDPPIVQLRTPSSRQQKNLIWPQKFVCLSVCRFLFAAIFHFSIFLSCLTFTIPRCLTFAQWRERFLSVSQDGNRIIAHKSPESLEFGSSKFIYLLFCSLEKTHEKRAKVRRTTSENPFFPL